MEIILTILLIVLLLVAFVLAIIFWIISGTAKVAHRIFRVEQSLQKTEESLELFSSTLKEEAQSRRQYIDQPISQSYKPPVSNSK